MNRTRFFALALALFTAAAPQLSLGPDSRVALVWGPSVVNAQVGVDPAHSPYHDIIRPNGWTLLGEHVYGDGGPLRISPNSGSGVGLRYDIKLSGLLQGFAELGYLSLQRPILLPDDSVSQRYTRNYDATVWTPHIGMQINLTGAKSWHGLAPFIAAGLGAAVGEGVAQDTTAFKFGTKLLFTPSVGFRYYLADRLHIRIESSLLYWKMKYPSGYLLSPAADSTAAPPVNNVNGLQDWVHTPSVRVGIGLAF